MAVPRMLFHVVVDPLGEAVIHGPRFRLQLEPRLGGAGMREARIEVAFERVAPEIARQVPACSHESLGHANAIILELDPGHRVAERSHVFGRDMGDAVGRAPNLNAVGIGRIPCDSATAGCNRVDEKANDAMRTDRGVYAWRRMVRRPPIGRSTGVWRKGCAGARRAPDRRLSGVAVDAGLSLRNVRVVVFGLWRREVHVRAVVASLVPGARGKEWLCARPYWRMRRRMSPTRVP